MDAHTVLSVTLILAFVLVGGVFAAAELALVSLRKGQLAALARRSRRGARVAAVARDPNRFLAAVQIGVTVAGFLSAAFGASRLAPALAPHLERAGLSEAAASTVALVALTLVVAYLSLVLGELVPKRLALQRAVRISLLVGPVLDRFASLMRPVIWALSISTDAVVRLVGGDPRAGREEVSEEELRELVATHEDLEQQERRILRGVFASGETTLREVMCPRRDVEFVAGERTVGDTVGRLGPRPHARYPVCGRTFDDVVGVLHVVDLLGVPTTDVRRVADLCRPALVLPGTKRVLPALTAMREGGARLAVVVDEYGGTDGIVTLEDLLAELIGEIRDERGPATVPRTEDPTDRRRLRGRTTISEFAETTGVGLEGGGYETVAGYVIARLGRIPGVGERVRVRGGTLEVTAVHGSRVTELRWHPTHRPDPGPGR